MVEDEAALPPSLQRWRAAGGASPPPPARSQRESAAVLAMQLQNTRNMREAFEIQIAKGAFEREIAKGAFERESVVQLMDFWDAEIVRLEQEIAAAAIAPQAVLPAAPN